MARRNSARLLQHLKTCCKPRLRNESTPLAFLKGRAIPTPCKAVERFASLDGLKAANFFDFHNKARLSAVMTRSISSYENDDSSKDSSTNEEHGTGKRDRLILRGCKFHGHHGVFEEEKKLGQKFVVDMDAWLDLTKPGETDNLQHSVSYAEVFRMIQEVVEGPSHDLLESVAHKIALNVLGAYPQITEVRLRIFKPQVAIQGFVDELGIEIVRTSSDLGRRKD